MGIIRRRTGTKHKQNLDTNWNKTGKIVFGLCCLRPMPAEIKVCNMVSNPSAELGLPQEGEIPVSATNWGENRDDVSIASTLRERHGCEQNQKIQTKACNMVSNPSIELALPQEGDTPVSATVWGENIDDVDITSTPRDTAESNQKRQTRSIVNVLKMEIN